MSGQRWWMIFCRQNLYTWQFVTFHSIHFLPTNFLKQSFTVVYIWSDSFNHKIYPLGSFFFLLVIGNRNRNYFSHFQNDWSSKLVSFSSSKKKKKFCLWFSVRYFRILIKPYDNITNRYVKRGNWSIKWFL